MLLSDQHFGVALLKTFSSSYIVGEQGFNGKRPSVT